MPQQSMKLGSLVRTIKQPEGAEALEQGLRGDMPKGSRGGL